MVLRQFPDLQWLKKQAEESFANRKAWDGQILSNQGWPTVILNVNTSTIYRDNIPGPLSIFTNLSGRSTVTCSGRRVIVNEGFFFVTNHDQRYTLEVDKNETAETCNIHFGEYFADQAFRSISLSPEKLIDEQYFTAPAQRIELYNKLAHRDHTIDRLIRELKEVTHDRLLEEEKLYQLLVHLLRTNQQAKRYEDQLPALKTSTRKEISKRLFAATDFIYSYYDQEISLDELASVSCLSKFHFLRLFKIAFNQTPHQFITSVKINEAKILLKNSKEEVSAIAKSLGFENASSFSRAFYNQIKAYPSQYRNSV